MKNIFKVVLGIYAGVGGGFVSGAVVWNQTGGTGATASYQWGRADNWLSEDGDVPSVAPTNGEDIAFSRAPETSICRLQVLTGATTGNDGSAVIANGAVDPVVATVSGGTPRHDILHAQYTETAIQPDRYFRIGQAGDFMGFWRVGNGKAYFSLESTADRVARMNSLIIDRRPRMDVPVAGTTAVLGETTGIGAIQKTGDGELQIGVQASGNDAIAYVSAGTATFAGSDGDALAGLMGRAAFRLDASAADTLSISNGGGRAWVAKWSDADGRERYVYHQPRSGTGSTFMNYTVPAFMCDTTSPTRLPLVSFGSGGTRAKQGLGPSNAVLKASSRLTGVREAFYVVETPGGAGAATILGDESTYHYISEGGLFSDYETDSARPIREGEVRINGSRRVLGVDLEAADCDEMTNCYVVSVASSKGLQFNLLGSDRYYMSRSGGSRMGELIVFTNELSRAERAQINRHLVAKWITGTDYDAKAAFVYEDAKIGVAAGRVSRMHEVVAPNGTLVKTGGGELRIARVGPLASNCTVRVEGGTLAFDGLPSVADEPSVPAAGAYLWLDSTKTGTIDTFESEHAQGKALVGVWRDCRPGVAAYAYCPTTNGTWNTETRVAAPTLATFNGTNVVDFGSRQTSAFTDLSRMRISGGGGESCYAGFMVVRNLASHNRPYFGSYSMALYRNTSTMTAANYENAKVSSGTWTIDGEAIDPISTAWGARYADTSRFQVMAFSLDTPTEFSQMFQDRSHDTYPNNAGRAQVGEVLVYHRRLSDRERRDTEAYLMRKWLGRAQPDFDQRAALSSLSFGTGVPAVVDSDIPLSIGALRLEGNSLVKRGGGDATIDVLSVTSHVDSLVVEGGTLSLSLAFDFSKNLLFHFDAQDEESLDTTVTMDGGGTLQTNVIKWLDVRRNGLYAESSYNAAGNVKYANCSTNPTLQRLAMPDGSLRPVVDFGTYNTAGKASGMLFHNTSAYGTAVSGKSAKNFANVRELHTVYAKPKSGNGSMTGPYAGNTGSNLSYYSPYWAVLGGSALSQSREGYIATNGAQCAYNTSLTRGRFYLLSLAPTANTTVGALAIDRGTGAGGGSMGEIIAFSQPLGDVQRRFLQETLMAKWLGMPKPAWQVGRLSVARGGSLVVSGGTPISATDFSGGGTVVADGGLRGLARLSFTFTDEGCESLSVVGKASFSEKVEVSVAMAGGVRPSPGVYTLVSATEGLDGAELGNWSLSLAGFSPGVRCRLVSAGGAVALRVWNAGMNIILR